MQWWIYIFVFNACIFLLMGVVVHFYFSYFSPYHFFSIPLSMLFALFFPLMLILHIFGYGGLLDGFLDWALGLGVADEVFYTPLAFLLIYLLLSFLAIFYKKIFYVLLLISCGFYAYLWYLFELI